MLLRQGRSPRARRAQEGREDRPRSCSTRSRSQWWKFAVEDDKAQGEIEAVKEQYDDAKKSLERRFEDKVEKLQRGDELPPGVMKMVKVFVAVKRKLQPGDKMAGRHGNKGVIVESCRWRTCRSSRTARRSTSCSTRSACRAA